MMKLAIQTNAAPQAIGPYTPAIRVNKTVYFSGQIPLSPESMRLVGPDIQSQVIQVLDNLQAVAIEAGGHLNQIVKLTVYLIDISNITVVNEVMKKYFTEPFPARTAIEVAKLPKDAFVEIDAIMELE